ncbi:conserved hypothetical protein [Taylorella asinigenitalis 14/45]|uniref:Uncharacterized protein n=1 Tax=Taylorella asinigenitalis 14/45 TaxID=1091495 RepID=I7IC49_9BURK|nr:hypothetical protein [Taylorella asinigenitalis]CCG19936.1 conserved hypothetical protein [Taylorella asinigenitalis 14/45]
MQKQKEKNYLPDWEDVLSASAHLQEIIPEAVLVGGTASVIYARHRISTDADHVVTDLKTHFDNILETLESVSGWKTARINRPVLILGSLDGIETGVRQLIRNAPLEKQTLLLGNNKITLPTPHEMLRIKGILILKRNSTRDYLDFVALSDYLGKEETIKALLPLDSLYDSESHILLQQLTVQLTNPMPFDLDDVDLNEYKSISDKWRKWDTVKEFSQLISHWLLDLELEQTTHDRTQ